MKKRKKEKRCVVQLYLAALGRLDFSCLRACAFVYAYVDSPYFHPLAHNALSSLFSDPELIHWTPTVHGFLFSRALFAEIRKEYLDESAEINELKGSKLNVG